MQRDGLKVLRFSKWKFVKGSDVIAFLEGVQGEVNERGQATEQGRRSE